MTVSIRYDYEQNPKPVYWPSGVIQRQVTKTFWNDHEVQQWC